MHKLISVSKDRSFPVKLLSWNPILYRIIISDASIERRRLIQRGIAKHLIGCIREPCWIVVHFEDVHCQDTRGCSIAIIGLFSLASVCGEKIIFILIVLL